MPRSTREIGAWIEKECGIAYEGWSGLIALLHRLGMEHRKPKAVSRKLDPDKQAAFIKAYEDLLNHLPSDESVMFGDAVHPMHAVRPVKAVRYMAESRTIVQRTKIAGELPDLLKKVGIPIPKQLLAVTEVAEPPAAIDTRPESVLRKALLLLMDSTRVSRDREPR